MELIVLLRDEQPRHWLAFGLVAGLGLLTKETILFWRFALVVGLLLTPQHHPLDAVWWPDRLSPQFFTNTLAVIAPSKPKQNQPAMSWCASVRRKIPPASDVTNMKSQAKPDTADASPLPL